MTIRIEVLLVPIIALIITVFITRNTIDHLYKEIIELNKKKNELRSERDRLFSKISSLNYKIRCMESDKNNSLILSNDEIEKLLRYAMKKSHPDNGGNNEDFVSFHSMYDSYVERLHK